jgi:tripartite-type tricarboxylate transporter receptor subunit TctC
VLADKSMSTLDVSDEVTARFWPDHRKLPAFTATSIRAPRGRLQRRRIQMTIKQQHLAVWTPSTRNLGRGFRILACWAFAFGSAQAALMQTTSAQPAYPDKPVRVIVAFAAGGVADVAGRLVSQNLSERLGQNFVIENHGGAGGVLGAKLVSSAQADGYTVLVTTSAVVISTVSSENSVNPSRQLTPVAMLAGTPDAFAVHDSVKTNNLMDYVRVQKGGQFTYATAGAGTLENLTSEYVFRSVKGLHPSHIPFRGGTPALNALMGQQVDMVVAAMPAPLALVRSGGLKILAVASHKRVSAAPNIPTLAEQGFKDVESLAWIGMFAPPGTPAPVVKRLNAAINEALKSPAVNHRLTTLGFSVQESPQPEFAKYVDGELKRWSEVAKKIGFSLN